MSVFALVVDVELAYRGTLFRVSFLPVFTELLADVEADYVAAVEVVGVAAGLVTVAVDVDVPQPYTLPPKPYLKTSYICQQALHLSAYRF